MTSSNLHIIQHPLIQDKLTQLREEQTNHGEFRRHMASIAYLLFYEAARSLPLKQGPIQTPLQATIAARINAELVLVAVLRAGLGFLDGILPSCPEARVGYIGLSRDAQSLEAHAYYKNLPAISADDEVFVLDPMLATGHTAARALGYLYESQARRIKMLVLVASPAGIEHVHREFPDVEIFTAAVDEGLTNRGYIFPGLGDAGDRLYGTLGHP